MLANDNSPKKSHVRLLMSESKKKKALKVASVIVSGSEQFVFPGIILGWVSIKVPFTNLCSSLDFLKTEELFCVDRVPV